MDQQTAKIFMNGRSQAVRLPREFRFEGSEVYIRKQGDNVVISPKKPSWEDFFKQTTAFEQNFMEDREDNLPQERELF